METPGPGPQAGFFAGLDAADQAAIRARARLRRFSPGTRLIHEGQPGTEVLVITSGRVKVTFLTRDGRERILDFRGPGDLIGEMAVVDGTTRSNTVEAIEEVEALAIGAKDFSSLVAGSATLSNRLLQNMMRRFRDSDRKLVEFGGSQTVGRVAARLVDLVERFGTLTPDGHVIDLPITQDELASWTGASLESVAKALHTLRQHGLITTDRRRFTIIDLEGLQSRYL